MREHPWNIRRPSTEHQLLFRNLLDLHRLSLAWNEELGPKKAALQDKTPFDPETASLEALLDDTFPDDLLTRLATRFQSTQALVLLLASKEIPEKLENASWKQGFECAARRWPHMAGVASPDLREVLSCLKDTFWGYHPSREKFLVQRATARDIRLELLDCPHQSGGAMTDLLCRQHAHWARGFVQALNPRISVDYRPGAPRCEVRWNLGM